MGVIDVEPIEEEPQKTKIGCVPFFACHIYNCGGNAGYIF